MVEIAWNAQAGWPILAALQLLPLIGAIVVLVQGESASAVVVGRLVALTELWLAYVVYRDVDAASAVLQLAEHVEGFGYHAAADGVTALFVLATALIVWLTTLYGMVRGLAQLGRLTAMILFAEAALMSMLVTLNLLWFVLISALELGVVFYLIGNWSTSTEENRMLAKLRFMQFQGVGVLLLGAATIILAWGHADATGRWSFDLFDLVQAPPTGRFQTVAFFLMFYGLAVRTPLFPLHGWLPHVAHRGMIAVAPSLLLGVKVGIYGMLRFMLPLTPTAVETWQHFVVAFAMTGVFYAAILAFLQSNLRRLLSFAVVSHTGLIVIGIFTLHPMGLAGSVLLAVNFGLAVTVMLLMVGFVFRRTRTTDLDKLGGLFERTPFIAICFLVGGFSVVGMPGTPGFDAAHLVLEAAMERFGALSAVGAALGNVAAAGFLLYAFQKAFLAPAAEGARLGKIERVQRMEYVVGSIAVASLLLVGFHVEPWLNLIEPPLKVLAARFGHG